MNTQTPSPISAVQEAFCWHRIGVAGSRTCPKLADHIHCRNCPTYASAGRALLNQTANDAQLMEWTTNIARERADRQRGQLSAGVFRIGDEWLALPTRIFAEIVDCVPVRRLPHTSGNIMLGLASIRGEIQICLSLAALLGIQTGGEPLRRFCLIGEGKGRWVFPVQEVLGIIRYREDELQEAPVAANAGLTLFSRGLLDCAGHLVGLLDEAMLLHAMGRSLQ